ncbi:MAG: glycosyltransferase family 4 protein [Nocardioides sp.]|jgi:glycosyltransferase involved in cell wall biosynthesis|nr:glycosyltransferase family 4 protein [Nocardioides sp.]
MNTVHVVVPDGIDDPDRPSGGNTYDRRVCDELTAAGWTVEQHAVRGAWPHPDAAACGALASEVAAIPDGSVVLLDGLVASAAPGVLVPEAGRLRLVVLVHMPLGGRPLHGEADGARTRERALLTAAAAVVTTSAWTRDWLLHRYPLCPERVHVAEPGVDAADLAPGTETGGGLLCVAAVTAAKGYDVLVESLSAVAGRTWHCDCVGTLDRDPRFVDDLGHRSRVAGLAGRLRFTGPRVGAALDSTYAAADVLVLASRGETYGMVVTEALARGIPVIATSVGGVPEALGGSDGERPGLLVEPGDPDALADALRRWLDDGGLRQRLRAAARARRTTLTGWPETARRVSRVLTEVAA